MKEVVRTVFNKQVLTEISPNKLHEMGVQNQRVKMAAKPV